MVKKIKCCFYMGFGHKLPLPCHFKVLCKLVFLHGLWHQAPPSHVILKFFESLYTYWAFGSKLHFPLSCGLPGRLNRKKLNIVLPSCKLESGGLKKGAKLGQPGTVTAGDVV